jgi:SAM-dependent methyltransferase
LQACICDYEGSDYRAEFWAGRRREYENLAERIALRRLLPPQGRRLVEIGAGFGRLADLYGDYEQVILLDYAKSMLRDAQTRLGQDGRFVYVAADLYRLPLADSAVDTAVTVRVLHHVPDLAAAFTEIARVVRPQGDYVLEYANKRHAKAIARYLLRHQKANPFSNEPYEFAPLNFDLHPAYVESCLRQAGFTIRQQLAVSQFRIGLLKRLVPAPLLAALDGLLQAPGAAWKLAPSIFVAARSTRSGAPTLAETLWRCPRCTHAGLLESSEALTCPACGATYPIDNGIYDFRVASD